MRQPSFFIVGAPKSGTTSLYRYLNQHPEIFMSSPKELNFFNTDYIKKKQLNLEEYLEYFKNGEGKICGEASPLYLSSKVAAENIYKFNPDSKIIIMLRNPVHLLYSYHQQLHFNGNARTVDDFQLALEQEAEKIKAEIIKEDDSTCYRSIVKFTEQIERYNHFFDNQNVRIIIFDDFAKDTPGIYKEVLEFLEVDYSFQADFKIRNSSKKVRSKLIRDLLKKPPVKILEIGKFLLPLPRQTRRKIIEQVTAKLYNINKIKSSKKALDLEFCLKLQKEFAPEIEKLSTLIARDVTFWNREDYWQSHQKIDAE
jgi:hypothetical protein